MYLSFLAQVQQEVREIVHRLYGLETEVAASRPPRLEMGDLALPLAMELARKLRRPPRQIAEQIAAALRSAPGVSKIEVAGAGYVNLFLNRATYAANLASAAISAQPATTDRKIIVEHTNINPNKAAHIGHLRNAALGDTFVRLLR
ncbi:MAG: arginine--tRNA ligase, partial [Acidobacteria bacterium]|nr:arginine--tRNA ligase [Acidobacteriota bacterium]